MATVFANPHADAHLIRFIFAPNGQLSQRRGGFAWLRPDCHAIFKADLAGGIDKAKTWRFNQFYAPVKLIGLTGDQCVHGHIKAKDFRLFEGCRGSAHP